MVLGFSYDDVVGCNQDWRLARQCVGALGGDAPLLAGVIETAGEGDHVSLWYVAPETAARLDDAGVPWRRFVIGVTTAPPPTSHRPLKAT
jgi:hypothetical protein